MKDKTSNGVAYTWDIVSSQGASFILYPGPEHTADDVKRAKAEIRAERDVVSIRVADEDDRDEDYRAQIFRDPRTKPLMWYEINADDRKLIRRERKAGTSVHDYVSRYVLPCIRETALKNKVGNPAGSP